MSPRGFDDAARALAAPISRRRALGIMFGAVTAGSALRPRAAQAQCPACPQMGNLKATQKCTAPPRGGFPCAAQVCVEPDFVCCSSTTCAQACKPWQRCRNGGSATATCDDTAKLCSDRRVAQPGLSTFCSIEIEHPDFLCSKAGPQTVGWCCGDGETCGEEQGDCVCDGDRCGTACCGPGQECKESAQSLCCGRRSVFCQVRPGDPAKCCPPGDHCWYPNKKTKRPECCSGDTQKLNKNGVCVCKNGGIRCRSRCCEAKKEVCSEGRCCPKGKISCDGGPCCKKGRCCGKQCCAADKSCLPGGICSEDLASLPPTPR